MLVLAGCGVGHPCSINNSDRAALDSLLNSRHWEENNERNKQMNILKGLFGLTIVLGAVVTVSGVLFLMGAFFWGFFFGG